MAFPAFLTNPEPHLGESFYIDYIYTPVVITATFKGRMGYRNKRKEAREGKNILILIGYYRRNPILNVTLKTN